MRKCIDWMKAHPWLVKRLAVLVVLIAVGGGSYFWGHRQGGNAAGYADKNDPKRVVAYVYNNVPVTRSELGEYLVDRLGAERLEFMLNRKIVEMECQKHNIVASDAEVQQRFQEDVDSFSNGPTKLTPVEFVNNILRRFGKTEFEWREDVIRPKIWMEKLVRANVKITDKDIEEGFEAKYGPKVECRMIVIDKGQEFIAQRVWENVKVGPVPFIEEAKKQFIPGLQQVAGKVPPIHKHFGEKLLEDTAFSMKVNEVSPLLKMKDGTYVILLCEKHIPRNEAVRIETEREKLAKEMHELRVAQKIPEAFNELRKAANVRTVLANPTVQQAAYRGPPPDLVSHANKVEPDSRPPVKVPDFNGPKDIKDSQTDTKPPAPPGIKPPELPELPKLQPLEAPKGVTDPKGPMIPMGPTIGTPPGAVVIPPILDKKG